MKSQYCSLLLACLCWIGHADAYSSDRFMYSTSTSFDSNNVDMAIQSEACANNCAVGDSVVQSGDMTIYEEFDSTICVDLSLQLLYSKSSVSSTADFCEQYHVTSVDGSSECPSPGEYTFYAKMTVTSLTSGASVTFDEHTYSCDGSGDIDMTFSGTIASLSTMAYGALGIVGIVSAIVAYRRRTHRVVTGEDMQYTSNTEFVQMNDDSSAYVA